MPSGHRDGRDGRDSKHPQKVPPAHAVSSGEDDDEESEESEKTRVASPDELAGDSAEVAPANPAETTKEKKRRHKKKKKKKSRSRSKTRTPRQSRTRSPSSTRRAKAATFEPAAVQDADARQKRPHLDQERLQQLEQRVKETKEEIRAKKEKEAKEAADAEAAAEAKREKPRRKAEKEKEKERLREEKERSKPDDADPNADQKPHGGQQGQQCPLRDKWLRSSSDFALSQHLWAVHPDHPESKKRSDAHKIVFKERGKSQPRPAENWNSQQWRVGVKKHACMVANKALSEGPC
eukprot:symbB.v1.2.035116.t1/scaffold4656.1/size89520/5